MRMELRKLDREYNRCIQADMSKKLQEFDAEGTPNLNQLLKEYREAKNQAEVDNAEVSLFWLK